MRRHLSLVVVWLGCSAAWMLLGGTLLVRSGETSSQLVEEVHRLWGPPLAQSAPTATYLEPRTREERTTVQDALGRPTSTTVSRVEDVAVPLPLVSTHGQVLLALAHRQKGLLWFPTYDVDFHVRYAVRNDTDRERAVDLAFPLPARGAIYDGFEVRGGDDRPLPAVIDGAAAHWKATLAPGATHAFTVRYRTRGTGRWTYEPGGGAGVVRDFRLELASNARGIDFAPGSISPTEAHETPEGWRGAWSFQSLVATAPVALELPRKVDPGPLAARVTFFAPVALLFYLFVVGLLVEGRGQRLHPLSWFLVGCGFFAFHLLFAYLADHVPLWAALTVASIASIALVVSYVRWFVGWRFALREMGLAQLVYLVGFSLTFLLPGYTGLTITAGAVLTLAMMMQVTGRRLSSGAPRAELVATELSG